MSPWILQDIGAERQTSQDAHLGFMNAGKSALLGGLNDLATRRLIPHRVDFLMVNPPNSSSCLDLHTPKPTSAGAHPVDRELPNNDGGTEGASWVHGTASEVDLGVFRIKYEEI